MSHKKNSAGGELHILPVGLSANILTFAKVYDSLVCMATDVHVGSMLPPAHPDSGMGYEKGSCEVCRFPGKSDISLCPFLPLPVKKTSGRAG